MRSNALRLALLAVFVAADAAEPAQVEARIKFISMTRPLVGVGVAHGKLATGVVIPTDMLSDQLTYRGPARLELIETLATEVTTKDKPVLSDEKADAANLPGRGVKGRTRQIEHVPAGKPPLAWVDLPANSGPLNLILLVTPGKGNGITLLRDTPGAFPPGSNRYINLAGFPVTVTTPSGDHPIAVGDDRIFRPGAPNNDYSDLRIKTKVAGDEVVAFSSRVFHMEKVRKLYLLLPAPGPQGRLIVRDIEDRPEPTKALGPTPVAPKGVK